MGRHKKQRPTVEKAISRPFTDTEKHQILAWKESKVPVTVMALKLGRHRTGIQKFLRHFKTTQQISYPPRPGILRKTTKTLDRAIIRAKIHDRDITTKDIIKKYGLNVCPQTIRNRLRESGESSSYMTVKKPCVSKKN
jgi:IS30 family transposase